MSTPPHRTTDELDRALAAAGPAPLDRGTVSLLVARPSEGERRTPTTVTLDVEEGLVGDDWSVRPTRTGPPDPEKQLNVIATRVLDAFTPVEHWALAGDQLVLDLDLGHDNLPAGTRLALGSAVIEVTPSPHAGCAKFRRRFGAEALRWVNSDDGTAERRRGLCAKVVETGTVTVGDEVVVQRG